MPKNDVTIYSPSLGLLLERDVGRTGGAEQQMAYITAELARRGFRVAVVVYALSKKADDLGPHVTIVQRGEHAGHRGFSPFTEAVRVLRALEQADGRVVVVRTGTPVVGFIAMYCLLRRRKFVFSSASVLDFGERSGEHRRRRWLYRLGFRVASAVVVQTDDQLQLAKEAFPSGRSIMRIPSFADLDLTPARGQPEEFLWVGRLMSNKQPLKYAELAAAIPEARFVLVPHLFTPGSAEQETLAQLREAAQRLPNLEILGPLSHGDLLARLERAVALVSTSVAEGMPNVFLEAWSRGAPVLTLMFDPDGIVREHELGISSGGSWERFVEGARELWRDRLDRAELSLRTQDFIRTVHSATAVGDQWETLLGSLGVTRRTAGSERHGVDDPGGRPLTNADVGER